MSTAKKYLRITTKLVDVQDGDREIPSNPHGPTFYPRSGGWDSVKELQTKRGRHYRNRPSVIRSFTKLERGFRVEEQAEAWGYRTATYVEIVEVLGEPVSA